MKHLLIILISILLLSSLLISCKKNSSSPQFGDNHKGETLYGWGNTLPYVWKGVGDKDTHSKYQGQVKDGKEHGQGTYTWFDGGIYVGKWKDGKEHGQGTYTSPVGTKYVGEWKEGKYDGQGTETWSSGWKHVGEWREGKPWNITIYGKSGIIILKYVNGVEQE